MAGKNTAKSIGLTVVFRLSSANHEELRFTIRSSKIWDHTYVVNREYDFPPAISRDLGCDYGSCMHNILVLQASRGMSSKGQLTTNAIPHINSSLDTTSADRFEGESENMGRRLNASAPSFTPSPGALPHSTSTTRSGSLAASSSPQVHGICHSSLS